MSARISELLSRAAAQGRNSRNAAPARNKSGGAGLFEAMARLYADMERAYNACAAEAGLSCAGCRTNCCTSFFQHHTYVEWAYLQRGLQALPQERRELFAARARNYLDETRAALAAGRRPMTMCPLNEEGLCVLYSHRLMICRMHGTRNAFSLPDGSRQVFPGCARFTSLPCAADEENCPCLDRTPFYRELAELEMRFLQRAGRPLPRVNATIAEMIVLGPPRLR